MTHNIKRLLFVGDTMLGRLVDASLPVHNPVSKEEEEHAKRMKKHTNGNPYASIWGNTLPIFHNADVRFINLECCITTHDVPYPNKIFNFRTHPSNVRVLNEAKIDFANLANNHILDYNYPGMVETIKTLDDNNIKCAGAGDNLLEAGIPAVVDVGGLKIAVIGAADHMSYFRATDSKYGINYVDIIGEMGVNSIYNISNFIERTKTEIQQLRNKEKIDLVVLSIHLGPNFLFEVPDNHQTFVKQLIDKVDINIIHGHSSHHVKAIEIYKGSVIMYGCGDYISDYQVSEEYRNDLSFIYELLYDTSNKQFIRCELTPTVISNLQTNVASSNGKEWLFGKMIHLCDEIGTETIISEDNSHLIIPIN